MQRIQDGMSAGTATLFIANAVGKKYAAQYPIEEWLNQGRYYTCRVVDYEGHTIDFSLRSDSTLAQPPGSIPVMIPIFSAIAEPPLSIIRSIRTVVDVTD